MKPPTTLDQQIALLQGRGLQVSDVEGCRTTLYNTSYYRLSGYARQFQVNPRLRNDEFNPGVSLEQITRVAELDTELALALLRCLGAIERVVRARFAYDLAHVYGGDAFYLDRDAYLPVTPGLDQFLDRVKDELLRAKSVTVARYSSGDDLSDVPVWVAFELLSFGTLSKMLEYLGDRSPRDAVANSFSEQKSTFPSTIHSLAVLRNRCAHHGQLWHRTLTIQTPVVRKEKREAPEFYPQGLYPALLATRRLLRSVPGCQAGVDELDRILAEEALFTEGILRPQPR